MEFLTIIMAAGKGTRMKSDTPKVLFKACGKPMVEWVIKACGTNAPIVIVGHKKEDVMAQVGSEASFAVQEEQKGTGHAVLMAKKYLEQNKDSYSIILAGDMPLIKSETIDALKDMAINGAKAVVLTAKVEDPFGYGRIIKNENGDVVKIVEQKDANEEELLVNEINSSVYCIKTDLLLSCLDKIGCDNAAGEYYLTDVVKLIAKDYEVKAHCVDFEECLGVNSKAQLAVAGEILRNRINKKLMDSGVIMIDPKSTYIEDTVTIGRDTVVYPNNIIEGNSKIGSDCILYQGSRITDSEIGDGTVIDNCVICEAKVGDNTTVGPFAYLRPKSHIGNECRIGDFVEVKNSFIDDKSKVSHLTYVGDSDVGKGVNIGCGVVFVNYDGTSKHRSKVGDDCFIGCNTNLISPVKLDDGAYTAAGSTITKDVPKGALAIAREKQVNKENWNNKWFAERKHN